MTTTPENAACWRDLADQPTPGPFCRTLGQLSHRRCTLLNDQENSGINIGNSAGYAMLISADGTIKSF
jgi:hypothetical protein